MRRLLLLACAVVVASVSSVAAETAAESVVKALVPFETLRAEHPGITRAEYHAAVRVVARRLSFASTSSVSSRTGSPRVLGTLSANPYDAESTSNPYGTAGSPYSSTSIHNPYGRYGSPYSSESVTNPYATRAPKIYARDGTYLGKFSSNPYDPESVSNPYGAYGSPYSATSINNPYSTYGSPYSALSPTNPYTTQGPVLVDDSP